MKKHVKRFLSLLMAICMVSGFGVTSAFAADIAPSDEKSFDGSDWATIDMDFSATEEDGAAELANLPQARVVVNSGVVIGVGQVVVYPAVADPANNQFLYNKSIYNQTTYASQSQTRIVQINPEETNEMLTKFKAANGVDADSWIMQVSYNVYTDGKGSYGRYFDFETIGDCAAGKNIRYNMNRNTSSSTATFALAFYMPENTSSYYDIGAWGSFTLYNAGTRKDLSCAAGVKVRLNSPF